MHVELDCAALDTTTHIRSVKKILREQYGIGHSTIEVEYGDCADHE